MISGGSVRLSVCRLQGAVSFAADGPATGSEGQSQVSSARRTSRATSDNGSDGGLSDGGHSYTSGDGSRSGARLDWWCPSVTCCGT